MHPQSPSPIQLIRLGVETYDSAWRCQLREHQRVRDEGHAGSLLLLEHKPVLTMGKNAQSSYVLMQSEELKNRGIDLQHIDRGGEVTAHMPGQLVIYPILPLQRLKLAPKVYVERLLETVISTLREFGIEGRVDPDYPGVWVGQSKICAIGIRIKERVSLHGLALNIDNDLSLFEAIVPCGIQGRSVTSMKALVRDGVTPSRKQVEETFVKYFCEVFGFQLATESQSVVE